MQTPAVYSTRDLAQKAPALRILVLDDDEFDRKRLERLVGKMGDNVMVHPCANVTDLHSALEAEPYDLCVMDYQLGETSGVGAVAALKEDPIHQDMPVIMVSGNSNTDVVVDSMRAGCANYVGKDALSAERLRNVIYDALAENLPDPDMATSLQAATNDVVRGIAKGCISELQPRLRRMYRQIDFIRSCHAGGHLPSPEALNEIEDHCLAIWRFFDEIESYSDQLDATIH